MSDKIETLKATPLQNLQSSIGLLLKDKEVDIPRGEAELWASQNPPLVKISKPALAPVKGK